MILELFMITIVSGGVIQKANDKFIEEFSKKTGLPVDSCWYAVYAQALAAFLMLIGVLRILWPSGCVRLGAMIVSIYAAIGAYYARVDHPEDPSYQLYQLSQLVICLHLGLGV